MAARGPKLPTLAVRQVGSYLGSAGRDANAVATAACSLADLKRFAVDLT
jgi:hypothetical protein